MSPGVSLIGVGLGPQDLGQRAREVLDSAQVLAGGVRLLDMFPDRPGQRLLLNRDLTTWLEDIEEASRGNRVAVLASGDPLFFGVGRRLIAKLGPERVEIFPNITSIQAAFARFKEPWDKAELVSLHGRSLAPLWAALGRADRIALLTDPHHTPARIAAELLERDQTGWTLAVAENLGQEDERVGEYSLAQAAAKEFSALNITVLKRASPLRRPVLGGPEEAYEHLAGLITKAEVRTVALGLLELRPGLCLWDLGAGCGSVGLEAGLLMPGGRVVAVEKNPARVVQIKANRKKFQAACLEVVQGEMPGAGEFLPPPDRVFVGGGGEDLAGIVTLAAQRLSPGGIVVVSLVMLESLERARQALSQAGLATDAVQVQISRSGPLASGTMLKALNPVWLVRGRKREES